MTNRTLREQVSPAAVACIAVITLSLAAGAATWIAGDDVGGQTRPDPARTREVRMAVAECPELESEIVWSARRGTISLIDSSRMHAKAYAANQKVPQHCSVFIRDLKDRERSYWMMVAGVTA